MLRSDESKVIDNVLKEARVQKKSVEFSSEEALKKYLKNHPKADPKKHKVKQKDNSKGKSKEKDDKKKNLTDIIEKKKKQLSPKPVHEDLSKSSILKMHNNLDPTTKQNVPFFNKTKDFTSWTVNSFAADSEDPYDDPEQTPYDFKLDNDGSFSVQNKYENVSRVTKNKITNKDELKKALSNIDDDNIWQDESEKKDSPKQPEKKDSPNKKFKPSPWTHIDVTPSQLLEEKKRIDDKYKAKTYVNPNSGWTHVDVN